MLIEHVVVGEKETSFHDFTVSVKDSIVTISPGTYYRDGEILFSSNVEAIIPVPNEDRSRIYEIWLTHNGFTLISRTNSGSYVEDAIDLLSWFAVNANQTDLKQSDINVRKIIVENRAQ